MKRNKRLLSLVLCLIMVLSLLPTIPASAADPADDGGVSNLLPYQDPSLSAEERALDLVSRMTLEEKCSQIDENAAAIPRLSVKAYQYWNECPHGLERPKNKPSTSFPVSAAIGCTWNPELIYQEGTIVSDEARAYYHDNSGIGLTFWAPTINLSRDPRWGRAEESYTEDPFLMTELAKNYTAGLQGEDDTYIKVISTLKHFAANNSEFNRHNGDSVMDERTLREYYTYAFQEIIEQENCRGVMTAYNSVNGSPVSVNTHMLDELLRKTWGFDGYVVSDCGAIRDIYSGHHWKPEDWPEDVECNCLCNQSRHRPQLWRCISRRSVQCSARRADVRGGFGQGLGAAVYFENTDRRIR